MRKIKRSVRFPWEKATECKTIGCVWSNDGTSVRLRLYKEDSVSDDDDIPEYAYINLTKEMAADISATLLEASEKIK